MQEPELLIRTGGENRLQFLLWQLAYLNYILLKIMGRFQCI